jgi:hypothetical protein
MDEVTKKLKQIDPKDSEIFLTCDNIEVILNQFAQDSLKKTNLAFFQLLHGVPDTKDIIEFKIELIPIYSVDVNTGKKYRIGKIEKDSNQSLGSINLYINTKKVGMKQFVQNLILNMNIGIVDTFMDISENPANIKLIFKKKGKV